MCLLNVGDGSRDDSRASRESVSTDVQWGRILLLPSSAGLRGHPFRDYRRVVEGIVWRYRVGAPSRDVPRSFGPWQTLWKRHSRCSGDGTWGKDQTMARARQPLRQTRSHIPRRSRLGAIMLWLTAVGDTP
ncbi:transposase [Rhodococcus sp. AG1013]|uniref:transposase n=1 Tax=Rhodococcus sp. AG1013 TaxID=2183996 RepID=UPI0015F064E1